MSYRVPKIEVPKIWEEERQRRRKLSRAEEKAIYKKYKGKCAICSRLTEFSDGEVDHIKPLSKGGSNSPSNLQWLCHRCNKLKGRTRTNAQVRKLLGLREKKRGKKKQRKKGKRRKQQSVWDIDLRVPKIK